MKERHLADVKAIAILVAGIYHRNDQQNPEGRTLAQQKRDAVAGVASILNGVVDDTRNARPIASTAVASVYGR
jgi:hypothetical protein